jgi:hypothetical protein
MRTITTLAAFLALIAAPVAAYGQSAAQPVGQPAGQQMTHLKQSTPTGAIGEISGAPVRFAYPLSKFVTTAGPLRLHDSATGSKIAVPFSARLKPKTVTLTLVFTNSIALDPTTSVMSVRFNEATLAQIRLDPKSPVGTAVINLPVELVRPGYNTVALSLTQHNGSDCEDPEAPELWTEINTAESSLVIDGEITAVPLRLSDINDIFSPGIGGARRLAMVTPALDKDALLIEAGALVAQAVALRTQYESVDLITATLPVQPGAAASWALDDQAVIGTRDQIAMLMEPGEAEKITGPYLGLRSLDRRQMRLIVSGRTSEDVVIAARALTFMDMPIADAVSATVRGIKQNTPSQNKRVQPERIYSFDELGFPTTTITGFGTQTYTLNLPMPPDLYAPEQAALNLLLDLNYGAGFGAGSVINVDVNGKFLHGIALTAEEGSAFRNYFISVPLRDLVGGTNQIGFTVIMRSIRKDKCSGVSGRHLAMTLFGSSSIEIPQAARIAAQPDLDLMVRTGFPYSENAASPPTIWVPQASLLGASWTFIGRLAQVSGGALPRLQFAVGGEPPRGSSILIGEAKSLPPRIFAGAMQSFGEVHRVPYSGFAAPLGVAAPTLWERMLPWTEPRHKQTVALPAGSVEQANDLGDNVILTAVKADGGGTVTVVTAAKREQLLAGVRQLVAPQYWGQARGDFMMWRDSPDTVVAMRLSPQFQTADAPKIMTLRFYVSQHPWWWLGGSMVVLMLLSGLTVWLLARRRTAR